MSIPLRPSTAVEHRSGRHLCCKATLTYDFIRWLRGALAPKPAGPLTLWLPYFLHSTHKLANDNLKKPTAAAIGLNSDGSFQTSQLKEYTALFSAALARSVTDQLEHELRRGRVATSPCECSDSLYRWVREAEVACSSIQRDGHWLPAYQPDTR